jgi:SAM-dependent methyltransferase
VGPLVRGRRLRSVLDVGSGTGFYVDRWRALGAEAVIASDLTAVAVERLRRRYPDAEVRQLDAAAPVEEDLDGRFDAISAIDVVFHVLDDAAYRQAFQNLARMLRPGGFLVFSEDFLRGPRRTRRHGVSRTRDEVHAAVAAAGLVAERRRPVFFMMNEPFEASARWLRRWWATLTRVVVPRPRLGALAGAALFPVDAALGAVLWEGPSTELMVCRRSVSDADDCPTGLGRHVPAPDRSAALLS